MSPRNLQYAVALAVLVTIVGCGSGGTQDSEPATEPSKTALVCEGDAVVHREAADDRVLECCVFDEEAPDCEGAFRALDRSSGVLLEEGSYKGGEKNGEWTTYDVTGQKRESTQFVAGRRTGTSTSWHTNGDISERSQFVEDRRYGAYAAGHHNGQQAVDGLYELGQRAGLWTAWYPNGQPMATGHYVAGVKQGLWLYWYHDGKQRAMGEYVDDERTGWWNYWAPVARKKPKRRGIRHEEDGDADEGEPWLPDIDAPGRW